MLEELKLSFLAAWTRFWDNRFNPKVDEEKNWLRLELDKERLEKQKLLDYILELNKQPVKEVVDVKEYKPIVERQDWAATRRKLQFEDRQKAQEMREKLEKEFEETKSTEQLEKEVGIA